MVNSKHDLLNNNGNSDFLDNAEFMEEDVVVNGSDSSEYDS